MNTVPHPIQEKKRLEKELLEARIRDLPGQAEEAAQGFNKILDECLVAAEVIKTLHTKLKAAETVFIDLTCQHQDSCDRLGIVKGLELRQGLGELAFVGSPFSMSFQVPDLVQFFVGSLLGYKEKLTGYHDFKRTNPTFEKDIAETQARDLKSGEWRQFGDGELGWEVFSPPRT